ncbi:uncharacterized protein LOC135955288 [Calliphora vicina]|uniref:uncharacterized protein LOC135955288 n=1 Tax=Calliphora vicina TaxID=7373 RepID=UPI00325A8EC5
MKTKHKSCVAAAAVAAGAGEKMKSVILYPYGPLTGTGCCRMLHAKNLAITSAIYTINISLLIVLIYSWRININIQKSSDLEDVYYGVQIAYFAIIGTQMSMIVLSIMLLFGIVKENPGLIVPWIIGYITFMALEAVAMVYSNVLRDHVNKQFDAMCKAEVAFFIARAFINVLSMWGVLRFYNLVRSGITWRGPEAKTTLTTATNNTLAKSYNECQHHHHNHHHHQQQHHHHKQYQNQRGRRQSAATQHKATIGCCAFFDIDDYDYDFDNDEDYEFEGDEYDCEGYYDDGDEYYDDEDESSDCSMLGASPKRQHRRSERTHRVRNNNIRSVLVNKRHNKYKIAHPQTKLEVINESERSAGSGSDENDSLLVAYNSSSSLASV